MTFPLRYLPAVLLLSVLCTVARAQNIVGWKILIGADAPAFIAFPSEVDNARWDNSEMNDYFKFSTRNENTMQISYNGKKDPPVTGTGFSVVQGKNTHIFTLVFKKDYDINKDPVLYYDFSDKAKLKAAAEQVRKQNAGGPGEPVLVANTTQTQQPDQGQKEALIPQKETAQERRKKQQEMAAQQKAEAEKAKQQEQEREAAIATAKAEAQHKAQEQQKAQAQEAAIARANAEAEKKKAAEALKRRQEQAAEDKRIAQEAAARKAQAQQEQDKASAERDRIAREEAERKRIAAREEQERKAQEQAAQAEAERQRKALLARQEAEVREKARAEAEARLQALQLEKEAAKRNAHYSQAGLWERYGKKGINLYDIPPEQNQYNNADFYVTKDTLKNFRQSRTFLAEPPRLAIVSEEQKGVRASLKSISFSGPIAYYRIGIQNNSKDDYLAGANNLAWYNPDGSPKVFLKCSYLTYIGFFPLVKPGDSCDYIYATRAANINAEDKLVLTINERRAGGPKLELFFEGAVYLQELARITQPLGQPGSKPGQGSEETRKDRKERRKAKKNKPAE